MAEYTCKHCGYTGPCYGTPFVGGKSGVSAPWCKRCGLNDGLTEKRGDSMAAYPFFNVVLLEPEPCPFCGQKKVVSFREHYFFCTECTAIFTGMIVHESNCDHIEKGVLTVLREPWHKNAKEGKTYIINMEMCQQCSICHAECVSNGW